MENEQKADPRLVLHELSDKGKDTKNIIEEVERTPNHFLHISSSENKNQTIQLEKYFANMDIFDALVEIYNLKQKTSTLKRSISVPLINTKDNYESRTDDAISSTSSDIREVYEGLNEEANELSRTFANYEKVKSDLLLILTQNKALIEEVQNIKEKQEIIFRLSVFIIALIIVNFIHKIYLSVSISRNKKTYKSLISE